MILSQDLKEMIMTPKSIFLVAFFTTFHELICLFA